MSARVASAEETIACERATIEAGTPSAELMRRAGTGAASVIRAKLEKAARVGVTVYAGPGNNGGDGWVVADALSRAGYTTRVIEVARPKSEESKVARQRALEGRVQLQRDAHGAGLIVDALLGTGSRGSPRGEIATAIAEIETLRKAGAIVVALDLPSGLDATTGQHEGSLVANETVTFGVAKRGHLIAREVCGAITVVDIGLKAGAELAGLPCLIDDAWVHSRIPPIPVSAHKGTRRRLAIIGGGRDMAGAGILAGHGALRSGIGLLRILCADESVTAVHAGIPAAIVQRWPETADDLALLVSNVDCIAIGPGLGKSDRARDLVERVLLAWSGPVVLDADALNVFEGDAASLGKLLGGRAAILTPHPAELGRLIGAATNEVVARRFEIGSDFSRSLSATVLLKGTPTVIFSPDGKRHVSASGTAALATGGSGDILTGITATLLAQMPETPVRATDAAVCAAFIHGRAAELCRFVRGVTLDDVLQALPAAWNQRPRPLADGILADLEGHA